jgi:hypothetical protein
LLFFAKGVTGAAISAPRGSFYDHVASRFSPQKPHTAFFKKHTISRILPLLFVMGDVRLRNCIMPGQRLKLWGR